MVPLSTDTVLITVNAALPVNLPPVANAGSDISITLPVNTASLDGSASSDPDGIIVSYTWKNISGPAQYNLLNPGAAIASVNNLVLGIYAFQLQVKDNSGNTQSDTVVITVNAAIPPVVVPPDTIPPIVLPPDTIPPVVVPPDTIPPVVVPPDTIPPVVVPPDTIPPVVLPPDTLPPVVVPPDTIPPVVLPPDTIPPIVIPPDTIPPVVLPPDTLPPVVVPPDTIPPVVLPPDTIPPVMIPPGNLPPVASTGVHDTTLIFPSNSIHLSGYGSYDPDGTIVSYSWRQLDGPDAAVIWQANNIDAYAIQLNPGNYTFELTVTDNNGAVSKDSIQVTEANKNTVDINTIRVYPNPVPGNTISIAATNSIMGRGYITIYDVNGRMIQETKFEKTSTVIEIHVNMVPMAKGAYVISIQFSDLIPHLFKIMKM